ncbi:gamma-glutamyltransferase [Thermoactinomyces sp. DSM 45892]|uniref:gamma-glutamyltransferase n=1 Tax=Thermoactinomyces sp. DSM 45892 TaxID=1882753 RepID=UPI0008962348|nr:gamma-glutamyltransferase [Thermoactinomyces sp. DSM 45892]SDZ16662.1 gamma-glutamyltransferase 1 Threonine peptidase. MEROPS family T03 [Thermoactinomyces sp. DSM 45892]
MNNRAFHIVLSSIIIGGLIISYFSQKDTQQTDLEHSPTTSKASKYGVAAAHPEAVNVGMRVLEQGGNAVDAAIAVSYALGVVEPFGSGIGGGGTMLIHPNNTKKSPTIIDYRETSPHEGETPTDGIGVPGLVKGMELSHSKFGSMPLEKLIQPSIELAEKGFEATTLLSNRLRDAQHRLNVAKLPHLFPNGSHIQPKQLIQQKELATTLKLIQQKGSSAFYGGSIAQSISQASKGITLSDLTQYQADEKKPLKIKYQGYEMLTSPPAGGGIMLAQSLLMSEETNVQKSPDLSSNQIHLLGEIQKRVNTSRAKFLGDPKYSSIPMSDMTDKKYMMDLIQDINPNHLTTSYKSIVDSLADKEEHDNTTHFVIVDKSGMMVSSTNTLSNFFGSGIYTHGFFLNNQLKNFSINKASPNRGTPGKRPLSYTAPTIFAKDGHPVIGIGSAGGKRITPVLTEVIIRLIQYKQPIQQAINQPRFLVEGNQIYVEQPLPADIQSALRQKGYTIRVKPPGLFYGGVQGIQIDHSKNTIEGGFDARRDGAFRASGS